jgi:FAD/FMN-containing dehydrogenase
MSEACRTRLKRFEQWVAVPPGEGRARLDAQVPLHRWMHLIDVDTDEAVLRTSMILHDVLIESHAIKPQSSSSSSRQRPDRFWAARAALVCAERVRSPGMLPIFPA